MFVFWEALLTSANEYYEWDSSLAYLFCNPEELNVISYMGATSIEIKRGTWVAKISNLANTPPAYMVLSSRYLQKELFRNC